MDYLLTELSQMNRGPREGERYRKKRQAGVYALIQMGESALLSYKEQLAALASVFISNKVTTQD